MNDLQVFNYKNANIRTVQKDGETWFVAKDIAEALGYTWQANLVSHIPEEWKGSNPINTPGGLQNLLCLSEQGLYFFLGRSDKPEALEALVVSEKEKQALQVKAEADKPKVEFFDAVASSKDALQMRDVAGVLNIPCWGRNKLFAFLRERKVLDARNVPYREYEDRGFFRVIEQKWTDNEGETRISLKTLVYQKGVDYIRKLIETEKVPAI